MKRTDLLTMMLYGFDLATRPTLSSMTESYESWLIYNRLHPSQMWKLKDSGMIEGSPSSGAEWTLKLTEKGRLRALGGRDPQRQWSRGWDGVWRLLMFDIPMGNDRSRRKLYIWLRNNHFGCLQKSVWLSPDPLVEFYDVLGDTGVSAGNVVAMDGRPCLGGAKSDAEFVDVAWRFDEINGRYGDYLDFAKEGVRPKLAPAAARGWVGEEQRLWSRAVCFDPLLPDDLLPVGYLGKKAWKARRKLVRKATPMVAALKKS